MITFRSPQEGSMRISTFMEYLRFAGLRGIVFGGFNISNMAAQVNGFQTGGRKFPIIGMRKARCRPIGALPEIEFP